MNKNIGCIMEKIHFSNHAKILKYQKSDRKKNKIELNRFNFIVFS